LQKLDPFFILNLLPGVGPIRVKQLLEIFGDAEGILAASYQQLAKVSGIGSKLAEIIASWQNNCDAEREYELVMRGNVHLVTPNHDCYPPLLREVVDAPLCLYVRGNVECLKSYQFNLAIVGSRRTTHYGVKMAEKLSSAAAMNGWTVVSGLARGIDTVAHQATVKMSGCTVAVLGSGLGHIYPQENVELAHSIISSGGVVMSEMPMLASPDRRSFPMRNRIISGLSKGVLVVEAGTKSGSLITANMALEQNRTVFAVPGRVDAPQSRGCHQLIKSGAVLVENFDDILAEFRGLPSFSALIRSKKEELGVNNLQNRQSTIKLSELEEKIVNLIGDIDIGIDEVVSQLSEPASKVISSLFTLEMRRVIKQLPGKRVTKY